MFLTVPVSAMPSASTWSVCFFFSSRSSSRTERRESTTLPRRRLSLMTLDRIVWPTMEARFFTGRRSTWEPGRNALTPTSTARPPLTTSTTRPSTGAPFSYAWVIASQTLILSALSFERTMSPSESSLASRYTSISSPTFGRVPWRWNSSIGMAPSLLYPTSTSTSLEPTWTTRPRTTSPSSNSVTPVPYQSSIRSSAASPPSPRGPPRVCFGSFIMPPVPPVLLFASTRVRLGLRSAGTARGAVAQPRDRLHHLAAGNLVSLLAISTALAVEPQRLAERDRHFPRARDAPAPRPRVTRALHVHRDHRGPAQYRQHSRARLGGPENPLVPARALREDQHRPAVGERPHRRAQRTGVGPLAPDRSRVQSSDQPAESRDLEQFRLRQERQLPAGGSPDHGGIEQARA